MKKTLKAFATELKPIIKGLLDIERDALGVETQYARIPHRWDGPEALLDAAQSGIDRRFRSIVGKAPDGIASSMEIRELLDAIKTLCRAVGLDVDAERTPVRPKIWTDREDLYEYVAPSHSDPVIHYRGSRVLTAGVRLNPDGSLRQKSNGKRRSSRD